MSPKLLIVILTLLLSYTNGYILSKTSIYKNIGKIKKETLKLRNTNINSNSNLAVCNEKYIYMRYLMGIRNFKKVYRIFKDNHYADIQNIINIITALNYINNSHFQNNSLVVNNTGINNEKIAKNLILSNIYIDVSTVKYIQISTKNDTLVVELDKNNADMSSASPNNILNLMYDIGKIESLVSSISLLLKVMNIH